MALRRSSLPLLGAILALFAVPASASAQTPPTNDTVATPAGWRTTPYVVELVGSDAETAVNMWYEIDGSGPPGVPSGTEITISTQGQLDFRTRAVDSDAPPMGSSWRSEPLWIDTVDPADASTPTTPAGPNGWHLAFTSFEVRAVDITSGVDHVEWSLDGGPTQNGPNGSNVAIATNGPHLMRTRAVDVAGNVSNWTDHIIRVDSVLPTDTTVLPTGWRKTQVDVVVKGVDAHSGVDEVVWVIDGGELTSASPSGQFTIADDGAHTVQTLVRDAAGNESGWKSHSVQIDRTAPNNTTTRNDAWKPAHGVEVKATDGAGSGVARVEWQIDGGQWQDGPSGTMLDFTTTGEYELRTRARDVAGNVSAERVDNVAVDATLPTNTTTVSSIPVSNPYQVAVTGTDAHSDVATVRWRIDGGSTVTGAEGDMATITGGGSHVLETRVVDVAGNESPWQTDTVTINANLGDNVPPVDTTAPAGSTAWFKEPITVTVQATDAGSGVELIEYRVPGRLTKSTATTATVDFDTEGVHRLETLAKDRAGNQMADWRRQRYKVDLSLPVDTTDIPGGWYRSNSFTLSGTDSMSGIDEIGYEIDEGGEQFGNPGQVIPIADGPHTITTRAIDTAGHSSDTTTRAVTVDTVTPLNTSATPGADWLDAPLELALTGTDLHFDKMQWRVDGGDIQDGSPSRVNDGEHLLETRAVDKAGNVSAWRQDAVKIDATDPVNTTAAAPAGWIKAPYTVEIKGKDGAGSGVDRIEWTTDGGTTVSNDPDVTISADGEHTLRSRIVDEVGHASDWREEIIKIDSAAPQAALSCSAGADAWSRAAVTCSVTADGGLSGLGSATLAGADGGTVAVANGAVATVSSDGGHTLRLDTVDGAGNAAGATATVYVDRTAPAAGLSCVASGGKYTCRVDASDGTSGLAALGWSLDGGAYTAIDAGGTFTVAKGIVRLRAVDAARNETITDPVTLAAIPVGVKVRISNVPVYLAGKDDADSMLGALNAVRSANGTVSLDLRPLAVGRGHYRVEIALKSGKRSRTVKRTYKVGRTGALPRISASLSKAVEKTTITLTVRKQVGKRWRKHAGTRLVLAK